MKKIIKSIIIVLAVSISIISCKKDNDIPRPVISNLEVGGHHGKHHHKHKNVDLQAEHKHHHSKGHIGKDLHVSATILAKGKIDYISIKIHNKGAEIVSVKYDDFKGQKNAEFHKHIDIPVDAKEGEYYFRFKVVDKLGQVTEKVVELELHKEKEK